MILGVVRHGGRVAVQVATAAVDARSARNAREQVEQDRRGAPARAQQAPAVAQSQLKKGDAGDPLNPYVRT